MAPLQPMYAKDEKVLCFHHELLYEAKVLDSKAVDPSDKKSAHQYKVHYKGWKNTWDDWVPEDRLRKFTEENKILATSLKKDMEYARKPHNKPAPNSHKKKAADTSSTTRLNDEMNPSTSTSGARGQKRGRDYEFEKEEKWNNKPSIRILIPDRLKSSLVDDWENVTKNLQLVPLPSQTPVNSILEEYAESERAKRGEGSPEAELLDEVVSGMKEYFNRSVGRILLYRFERQQFLDICRRVECATDELSGKTFSEIYGGEHLLRLFVSMPDLIAQTNMDQQSVSRLREELSKMALWISKDVSLSRYFSVEYETAPQDYVDYSKGSATQSSPGA